MIDSCKSFCEPDFKMSLHKNRITIKDVAEASGVSEATVSQVLGNGSRPVNSNTRARILKVACDLDYRPSAVARALVKRRTDAIGIALPHWNGSMANAFLMELLEAVLSVCTPRRKITMLCTFPSWEEAELAPGLTDGRCDGVLLLVPPASCSLLPLLQERGLPFVLVNANDPAGRMFGVDVDNIEATRRLTQHLLDLGHRRIAFLSQPWDVNFPFFHERFEGFRQAMAAAGHLHTALSLDKEEVLNLDWSAPDRPTAIVGLYDALTLCVMERLMQLGVRVPQDVSVVGFDDISAAARALPPLTTMRQPIDRIGRRSAEMLLDLIDDKIPPGRQEYLPTELIIRESTAPPAV